MQIAYFDSSGKVFKQTVLRKGCKRGVFMWEYETRDTPKPDLI